MSKLSLAVPRPYDDELLYSVVARSRYYLAEASPKRLAELLFGCRTMLAVADLPTNLDGLAWLFEQRWHMSAEDLAYRHTLFGYVTHFLRPQERRSVLAAMCGNRLRNLHLSLGICASSIQGVTQFRLCPACVDADIKQYGETYWRRTHHLPGIFVCSLHGMPLLETVVPFRPLGRHEFVGASTSQLASAFPSCALGDAELRVALDVARASAALLSEKSDIIRMSMSRYRERLTSAGYGRVAGSGERLRAEFGDHYGAHFLAAIFKNQLETSVRWLDDVRRKPRRSLHPLKYVLLDIFLSSRERAGTHRTAPPTNSAPVKTWGIYRSEDLRARAGDLAADGRCTRQIALALGIDWKTANRLLQPVGAPPKSNAPNVQAKLEADRMAWSDLVADNPCASKTQLRRIEPALYARLYRGDREFIGKLGAAEPAKAVTDGTRVDWPARDEAWVQRIREAAGLLFDKQPMVRVSRSRVLGELQGRALFAHYGQKLPLATCALEELCESVEAFQARRMSKVLNENGETPDWKVFAKAAINPSRRTTNPREMLAALRASDIEYAPEERRANPSRGK